MSKESEEWDSKYRRALVLALLKLLEDAEWCQECAVATDPLVGEVRAAFAEPAR